MNDTRKQALPVGTRIGVYEIRRVIGTGRFGITYQAWNQHLNAEMALKEYFPSDIVKRAADGLTVLTSSDRDERLFQLGLDKCSQDADKLARIEHPHLERVQNDLQIHGTIYLAMEYEDGIPLSRVVKRSGTVLDEAQVKVIFLPIIDALAKVHEAGVIHGDINPDNILLRKSGESVLLDFASARLALAAPLGIPIDDSSEGYTALEQYDPQGQTGPWTDLYSLGATMYRCVTGNNPLSATDRSLDVSQGKSDPQWPAVEAAVSGYHEEFLKAIDWMLAIRPEDRPQSVAPLLESLTAGSEEETEVGTKSDQKTGREFAKSKPSVPRKARSSVPLLIFAGLAAVLLIATSLWYSSRDRRGDEILAAAESQRMASLSRLQDKTEVSESGSEMDPDGAEAGHDTGVMPTDEPEKEAVVVAPDSEAQDQGSLIGADDPASDSAVSLAQRGEAEDGPLSPGQETTGVDGALSQEKDLPSAVAIGQETEMSTVDETTGVLGIREEVEEEGKPAIAGTQPSQTENLADSGASSKIASARAVDRAEEVTEAFPSDRDSGRSPEFGRDAVSAGNQDEAMAALPRTQERMLTEPDDTAFSSPDPEQQVHKLSAEGVVSSETLAMEAQADFGETPSSFETELSGPTQQDVAARQTSDMSETDLEDIEVKDTNSEEAMVSAPPAAQTREDRIAQHMAAAEEHIAALRLSTPLGENALEHYQAVIELDSDHSEAREGVRRIVDVYVRLIDRAIEQEQLVAARVYLGRAEKIMPEAPGLQRVRFDLNAERPPGEVESTQGSE